MYKDLSLLNFILKAGKRFWMRRGGREQGKFERVISGQSLEIFTIIGSKLCQAIASSPLSNFMLIFSNIFRVVCVQIRIR